VRKFYLNKGGFEVKISKSHISASLNTSQPLLEEEES
jgi:hypothetical protein